MFRKNERDEILNTIHLANLKALRSRIIWLRSTCIGTASRVSSVQVEHLEDIFNVMRGLSLG